jgi:hypothetical protein
MGIEMRNSTYHKDSLDITVDTTLQHTKRIEGSLVVRPGVTLVAPCLTNVGEHVTVHVGATLIADHLTTLGWNVLVCENATVVAPSLTYIHNHLEIYDGATVTSPELMTIGGGVTVAKGATLTAPYLFHAYGRQGREIARCPRDGYVLWLSDSGFYSAGSILHMTRDEALKLWGGDTERAKLFTAAILNT